MSRGPGRCASACVLAMMGANKKLMHFNAQADAKSHQSRSLRSYCLGQYGDTIEECARPQATTYIKDLEEIAKGKRWTRAATALM